MKKLSRSRSAVTLLSVLALSACSSSDDDSFDESIVPDEPINPIAGEPVAGDCPLIGNLQSLELASNECQISGVLTENATLTADRTWFLEGALQIGDETVSATLDIEGGTQIRGDNQDLVDYVLVYPGSSLNANGTGANPVHFLSDDDDVDGSGEWGGVFLRGI